MYHNVQTLSISQFCRNELITIATNVFDYCYGLFGHSYVVTHRRDWDWAQLRSKKVRNWLLIRQRVKYAWSWRKADQAQTCLPPSRSPYPDSWPGMHGEPKIGSYLICSTHEIALLLTNQGVKYALLWQKDRLGSDWSANCSVSYQNTNAGDLETYLRTIQGVLWWNCRQLFVAVSCPSSGLRWHDRCQWHWS